MLYLIFEIYILIIILLLLYINEIIWNLYDHIKNIKLFFEYILFLISKIYIYIDIWLPFPIYIIYLHVLGIFGMDIY